MKKIILLSWIFTLLVSCKSENKETVTESADTTVQKVSGKDIFEGEGNCIACHKPDQKVVGPSLQEIAIAYKAKKGNIVLFLKEEADPIIDPSQYDIMKANFAITKGMTDEQLQALEDYIYTFSK